MLKSHGDLDESGTTAPGRKSDPVTVGSCAPKFTAEILGQTNDAR